jgi:hypothetical protein
MWGVGLIAVLCGLMRQLRADFTQDIMWDYTELLIWTALDVSVGVITISLPVMDAWLAGAWRGAVTKLGGRTYGVNSNHRTPAASKYALGSTVRSTVGAATPKKYSDSIEEIIQKNPRSNNDETELNTIVRTDEYNVFYSSAGADSDGEDPGIVKVYNKQLSRTFSTK